MLFPHVRATCPTYLIQCNFAGLIILVQEQESWGFSLRRFLQPLFLPFLFEANPLCISNLYNILRTVNTQHTSRQDALITIRLYLATCFGRNRPSSGQLRTILRCSKNSTQWDPIFLPLPLPWPCPALPLSLPLPYPALAFPLPFPWHSLDLAFALWSFPCPWLALPLTLTLTLTYGFDVGFDLDFGGCLALTLTLSLNLTMSLNLTLPFDLDLAFELDLAFDLDLKFDLDLSFGLDLASPHLTSPYLTLTYLLTYLLTPWCRVLLEKLTGLQLVKKFPAFHGTRWFITALTSVRHLCLSWASPIQSSGIVW